MQKWIIGCEESQTITLALRRRGIYAMSCDLLPCSGGHPEWHIQGDIFEVLRGGGYSHGVFHPECTRLTVAANKWYKEEYKDRFPFIHQERKAAIEFFMRLTECGLNHWAIENPIGIMSNIYRKPDQIIQPYYFGDTERKGTCLWLHNLPKLVHTREDNLFSQSTHVKPDIIIHKSGKTDSRLHYETFKLPKEERRKARSVTFQGIANAIAEQWGAI